MPSSTTTSDLDEKEETFDLCPVHPLVPRWTLYVWKSDYVKDWPDCIYKQATISTIEEFWALNYRIIQPSLLNPGTDYMFFKEGIQPMWEDPKNINGGVWSIDVERQFKYTKSNRYWLELLMAMLGGQFDDFNEYINGAVYNQRVRGAKLCVWVSDEAAANQPQLRELIDAKLGLATTDRLYYRKHTFKSNVRLNTTEAL